MQWVSVQLRFRLGHKDCIKRESLWNLKLSDKRAMQSSQAVWYGKHSRKKVAPVEKQLPEKNGDPVGQSFFRRGKLTIFFGYAGGVGKTYAMLERARSLAQTGTDVVIGAMAPELPPETEALLEGLELLSPKSGIAVPVMEQRQQTGFPLDLAIARKPQVLVMDQLALQNPPGGRHVWRYQDIQELLRSGICVYTTLNVENLEGLWDIISHITGTRVQAKIPDALFEEADGVEMIDMEPEALLARREQFSFWNLEQEAAQREQQKRKLMALREIALRRCAERLNRWETGHPRKSAGVSDHILACLSSAPTNSKVIRTAAKMAEAFHGEFTALYVESSGTREKPELEKQQLRENLRLAEELGARITTLYGDEPAVQIAEYARAGGVSKIVLGRSPRRKGIFAQRKTVTDKLSALLPDLDIYIIPDQTQPEVGQGKTYRTRQSLSLEDLGKTLGILAISTLFGFLLTDLNFVITNVIIIYILGVLVVAMLTGSRWYSLLASGLSVLIFNFFFTYPYFTLFSEPGYVATFLVMFLVAVLGSSLTSRVKRQAVESAQKAYRTEVLLQTSQKLQKAEQESIILAVMATQLNKLLERAVLLYPVDDAGQLGSALEFPTAREDLSPFLTESEQEAARWVWKNNKHAGATTNTFPAAHCLYVAVRGAGGVLAVAGIVMAGKEKPDAFEKNLMIAIIDECGLALEKERLGRAKQKIEQEAKQEALRANLLRAISHDLRTPLTSISGNAGILMENSAVLDEGKKKQLYSTIYDDAMWLFNLVENLLSVTRIENGTMGLKLETELIEEVFQEALDHLDRRASEHVVKVQLEEELLMAPMDARLIVQVIINIVNNAITYTPPGSHILLSARQEPGRLLVTIADDGPGVSDADKGALFTMFYTANNERGDGRRGLGLGLSLCKAIISAHGGIIGVKDNVPKGACFYFTLPTPEVKSCE